MGRILIFAGVVLIALGVLVQMGVPLGRLPGDIVIRREHTTIYFPIVTGLLLSVVLSLALWFLKR
jgi:hypothetical protein